MKRLLLITSALLYSIVGLAQKNVTMCHSVPTEKFAALASIREFRTEHEAPIPYLHRTEVGKDITFTATDGETAYAYELKSESPSDKYLFVFHEWWGLNEHIKKEAEKLYSDLGNVNVLAIDLYDQKLATTPDEAGKLVQSVETERAHAIIKGALNYIGDDVEIATIGWCFGGGWSLQATLLAGETAEACVIYYGMPEQDVEKLKKLNCEVLGIFGSEDQWIGPDVVKEFAQNMGKANKELQYKIFDANHAFANPSNPNYDSEATKEAYEMTISFLKGHLK